MSDLIKQIEELNLRCDSSTLLPVILQVEQLLKERDELRQQVENIKNGFEGGCYLCEVVGEMNKRLQKERDEARREVCDWCNTDESGCLKSGSAETAIERGWDCFKEEEMACDTLSQEVSQEGSKLPTTISSNGICITEYIPPQNSVREIPPYGAYTTGECTLSVHTIKKTQ